MLCVPQSQTDLLTFCSVLCVPKYVVYTTESNWFINVLQCVVCTKESNWFINILHCAVQHTAEMQVIQVHAPFYRMSGLDPDIYLAIYICM